MATTAPNLHSLSSSFAFSNPSSNVSATSFTFQIPNKKAQISCISSKKLHTQKSFNFHDAVTPMNKPSFGRDLMVAQATEAVAPTTEEAATSQPKTSKKAKKLKYPRRILDVYQILQSPIITEAAIKNIADENSLLFTVDVRADKKMIREAISNFFGVKVRKVNTLIRPDGTKKAYIMLNKEYNASELAKKIGIFPGGN
uniref:Large ribosomal subunit protein uL23c n=3 Tax=Spinacia oleracea TaxID=3562 RepID=RK23_SPIOL|nr:RecName: Full=Large ribosomal subunit protein uL23c; AltName: Full=50S ribosomal protein L23, chloroplastic; AltName: Full=PRPL23; Flags: Precursor [Spinacia oleracea]4V61_BV Chain BV, Ribosomal Protein L23 [Spinacia oleracea]5MLC_V Chain V, 50S ribosomal protein L23, chloroplastic [Spinacia oleracea]5MMI_U Chain U, 50S ribosomal protein L23, chloroplastic [Spinacia oleracea]5MMM_U Chain U, 50S ribosomal protein L23, chloroplastic [Spinacia oleracea]CAA62040.1 Chloroplast ribosomal protein 